MLLVFTSLSLQIRYIRGLRGEGKEEEFRAPEFSVFFRGKKNFLPFVCEKAHHVSTGYRVKKAKYLIINGSPSGAQGNCARWIEQICSEYPQYAWDVLHLSEASYSESLQEKLNQAEAFIFVTGTYWDSWGSPLQKFLEDATELEGSPVFLGKPAGVLVLMHSVGGKGVLSRLQGVLNTLGCLIPPMAGMTYSLVSALAAQQESTHAQDFWAKEDVGGILQNIELYLQGSRDWMAWPVDRKDPRRLWLK